MQNILHYTSFIILVRSSLLTAFRAIVECGAGGWDLELIDSGVVKVESNVPLRLRPTTLGKLVVVQRSYDNLLRYGLIRSLVSQNIRRSEIIVGHDQSWMKQITPTNHN
jgi:hypothetical protein